MKNIWGDCCVPVNRNAQSDDGATLRPHLSVIAAKLQIGVRRKQLRQVTVTTMLIKEGQCRMIEEGGVIPEKGEVRDGGRWYGTSTLTYGPAQNQHIS